MTNIRRYPIPDTQVFITAVCQGRKPFLAQNADKAMLLDIMRELKTVLPYRMIAYVILDDHFHWIIQDTTDFSRLMQSLKLRFTHRYKKRHAIVDSLIVWQRRFWDHLIRNEEDRQRHLDYIHYNPVKHGYVNDALDYSWSSFRNYAAKGYYPTRWAVNHPPSDIESLHLE